MRNRELLTITAVVSIDGSFSPENGEDAAVTAMQENKGIIACLDGCGGSGAQPYRQCSGWTGARIASHFLGRAIFDWFVRTSNTDLWTIDVKTERISNDLHGLFDSTLEAIQRFCEDTQLPTIRGRMVKQFPTTLSMALIHTQGKKVYDTFLWAGDSRGYLFTSNGLIQMTRDDVQGALDPYQNLIADGVLSNVIHAGGKYVIHARSILLDRPHLVLTATDGCFAFFHTPMEMELVLLKTLEQAQNPNEWGALLEAHFRAVASDDFTMRIAIVGFQTFQEVKTAFAARHLTFRKEYAEPMERITREGKQEDLQSLWDRYKTHYIFEEVDE